MSGTNQYVRIDEHGVMRVGKSRVMLDSVIAAFLQGHSPETIRQQYRALSLEEVYGSLAFYLANTAEVDQYLQRQEALWAQLKAESDRNPSAVVRRLQALIAEGATGVR